MTDTKLTLENQIAVASTIDSDTGRAILASLKELQSIRSAELPVSVSVKNAIGTLLNQAMEQAVANGANSISMPDEYVEIAAWLCGIPEKPAELPAEPETLTYIRNELDEGYKSWLRPVIYHIDALKLCIQKHDAELSALRGRLMEPDEEMLDAAADCRWRQNPAGTPIEIFKAMSAVALKEGE